ncbi:pantoate--beta-alanine ligase [Siphonobacter aquaeclarae]|uniref:Pantothenate synthetase n=1 Tax=Siphonobacter aquaeclarae TaxID=563176 RepID=A0A1G9PNH6_9BACT|nr:pantoate--beta-alanine ligase [Siphonobacter aquaeclarae]SDM00051.1 pantothenate synthetase [Siphonobacter aquaeclarae]
MHVFNHIQDLRAYLAAHAGKSVGFVPTMGALHEGHLTLIRTARAANDLCVCSIFVNPIQFNNTDDLARYPRVLEDDVRLLETVGCDAVFAPSVEEMYPTPPALTMQFGPLERVLEGAFRPGHFSGVGVVVSKLLHIVSPDRVYFGQKDLQQCLVVRRLIEDLSFPVEQVIVPTVREADGLAMSSRNRNLTPEERAAAPFLYAELTRAAESLKAGTPVDDVKASLEAAFAARPEFRLEYFDIADTTGLVSLESYQPGQEAALTLAAHLGKVRLIDNVLLH